MKKVLCLILTLSLVMLLGTVSFAATGSTDITEPVPGAPVIDVNAATYVELPNETNAGGSVNGSTDGSGLNEAVPGGDAALPKTGGIPAETFYAAGALIVLAALIISRKKVKAASK